MWDKLKNKKWRPPVLKVWIRILLYIGAILFAALSFWQIETGQFSKEEEFVLYMCAAGTTFPSCLYIVMDMKSVKKMLTHVVDRLAKRYKAVKYFLEDYRFRTFTTATAGLLLNIAFTAFHGIIGFMSRSLWYITLAVYYLFLSIMRAWIVGYERKQSGSGNHPSSMQKEIQIYKVCSMNIILLTVVLGGMVILMVRLVGGRHYPGMTIYIVALYTFIKVPLAVRNLIKTTKMKTPLLVAIRSIGYADACVSVLSLQTAMFSSFGNMEISESKGLINGITGVVVCLMVSGMGIYGVCMANKMKMQDREDQ